MMRLRKIWAEGSFSVLKREHCLSKIKKRDIPAVTEECLLSAMALNLKRMVRAILLTSCTLQIRAKSIHFQLGFLICQQVPYCPLSALSSFGMKKINCLWNHTRWNIRKRIFLAGFSTRKWKREARQKQRTKAPAAAIPDVVGIPDSAHRFCTILKQNIWANQKQSPMDEK